MYPQNENQQPTRVMQPVDPAMQSQAPVRHRRSARYQTEETQHGPQQMVQPVADPSFSRVQTRYAAPQQPYGDAAQQPVPRPAALNQQYQQQIGRASCRERV